MPMKSIISQPLLSVVVATYNGERFIREQMDSIIAQTYKNIEIIVVDDCSTDATVDILQQYAKQYSNIRLFVNSLNLGYIRNFEKGFLLATGDYIAPSDQDDIWVENKLEILMSVMGDNEIVYCNSAIITNQGEPTGKLLSDIKHMQTFTDCLQYVIGNTASGHAMIVRRNTVVNSVPFANMVTHDYWLGFVATFNSQLLYVDQPLVLYRQHGGNLFGVNAKGVKRDKRSKITEANRLNLARERMNVLYEKCPDYLLEQKAALAGLVKSYRDFSLINDFNRMRLFFKYRHRILAYKKRTELRRILFCIKMFWMIK